MRKLILIILAGLLTAAVARPFQKGPSLSLPSTRIPETSSTVPDGTLVQEQPGNGIYYVLATQSKHRPDSVQRMRLVKRQEYHILPEPNVELTQETSVSTNEAADTNPQTTTSSQSSDEPPPAPPRNLVPHWSHKKHSIAAAVIFIIVVVVAFVVLLVLYFQKVKRFFERRRWEKKSYLLPKYDAVVTNDETSSTAYLNKESKMDRDAFSFEIDRTRSRTPTPPPEYVVEEEPNLGSVTGVYAAPGGETLSFPSACGFHGLINSPPVVPPTGRLRESVQRPVLIVPTPLNPLYRVRSFSATTELQQSYEPLSRSSQDDGEISHRSSTANESRVNRYSDPGPSQNPNRVSFLPRIYRSSSPLFSFED